MKILIKALLILGLLIVVIHTSLYTATGTWTTGFGLASASMQPNMHIGDLILIQSSQRTNIITYEDSKASGYRSFNDYGDVIVVYPLGNFKTTPFIHRAMYYVAEGEPMWAGGSPAPHAGYITKGDNIQTNPSFDQQGSISYLQPVKKEWIVAVARARVPFLGYLSSGLVGIIFIYAVPYMIILWLLLRKEKHISLTTSPPSRQ